MTRTTRATRTTRTTSTRLSARTRLSAEALRHNLQFTDPFVVDFKMFLAVGGARRNNVLEAVCFVEADELGLIQGVQFDERRTDLPRQASDAGHQQ